MKGKIYKFLAAISIRESKKRKWMLKFNVKNGMIIGENTHVFTSNLGDPFLVEIGSYSTISTMVNFVTHDASVGVVGNNTRKNYTDLAGKIFIGNHCFIGTGATIMYGVSISDGVLVAAGSVVTHSVKEENVIVAGNPAKIIGNTADFVSKKQGFLLDLTGLNFDQRKSKILNSRLVKK